MSKHFLCEEILDIGELAEKLAEEEHMPRRERAKYVFLQMREIERLASMRGNNEVLH